MTITVVLTATCGVCGRNTQTGMHATALNNEGTEFAVQEIIKLPRGWGYVYDASRTPHMACRTCRGRARKR
jgi:hypothetical protein